MIYDLLRSVVYYFHIFGAATREDRNSSPSRQWRCSSKLDSSTEEVLNNDGVSLTDLNVIIDRVRAAKSIQKDAKTSAMLFVEQNKMEEEC